MEKYTFNNYGGSYQLSIKTSEDLKKILDLDEALWAATSIPINVLNVDKKFLEYLDVDKNGRIRTDEIKIAVRWFFNILKDYSHISEATNVILLDNINIDIPEGKILKDTAKIVLSNLNEKDNPDKITLYQVRNLQGIMASSTTNGDGIIIPDVKENPELSELINLIMETIGISTDASGKSGINGIQATEFFAEATLYLEWLKKGKIPDGKEKTDIMIWGRETPNAFILLENIEKKVDEFFAQCAMTQFDNRVKNSLQLKQKELDETDFTDKTLIRNRLKTAPLAEINSEGVLPLNGYINSLFVDAINNFKKNVLVKIYGEDIKQLTQRQWEESKNIFSKYRDYVNGKKGGKVVGIEESVLKKYAQGDFKNRINTLIQKDLAAAEKIKHIRDVEKMILYQKFLLEFANNSASFAHVYDPKIRSIFEAGTLVIDGRKIPFTILITDRNEHKEIAQNSNIYLMYLNITGRYNEDIKFEIVAAVTSGDSGTLRIGKRGIFFTRDGKEWDAEVIDIAVNPIGLLESIKAPFMKLSNSIKNQVEKFAKTKEAKMETTLVAPSGTSAARDLLVGGGIAIAALGSSFAYIAKAVSQIRPVHFLTTIGIILFIILFPSIIIGFIKLRRRNLSILFEASGCAINVKMKLTVGLGRLFTFIPSYPACSQKNKTDIVAQLAKKIKQSKTSNPLKLPKITLLTTTICLFLAAVLFLLIRFLLPTQSRIW